MKKILTNIYCLLERFTALSRLFYSHYSRTAYLERLSRYREDLGGLPNGQKNIDSKFGRL